MGARIRLPAPEAPVASVVVLGFRRADVLARCLGALASHRTEHPFEVVVVLNGASPAVRAIVDERVEGGVVVASRVNLGFAGGCNRGVAASHGRYVALLNDDAVVEPGWLDALVGAAELRPKAAVIGSLVLFPDGSVQDAGGEIGPDGMPVARGRGLRRGHVFVSTPRPIDYASASAVLVRRDAWDAAGGFDERFYPAYFEDADLCLRLRSGGWEVWYEPGAAVRHDESASTDLVLKSLAWDWNKERFLSRWGPGGTPPPLSVGATSLDLLETEVAFLQRAADVHEERLARTARLLEQARFELSRLRADHLGALEVLEAERAHAAWLAGLLEAERARADAAVEELRAIAALTPGQRAKRWLRDAATGARKLAR